MNDYRDDQIAGRVRLPRGQGVKGSTMCWGRHLSRTVAVPVGRTRKLDPNKFRPRQLPDGRWTVEEV